mmetsp:Transcript_12109/g.44192  ORF Transcript_12109/g.44192 Transcript_12109/m.44192 type:complete len:122 (-) Transcript_12109:2154-2519(-)
MRKRSEPTRAQRPMMRPRPQERNTFNELGTLFATSRNRYDGLHSSSLDSGTLLMARLDAQDKMMAQIASDTKDLQRTLATTAEQLAREVARIDEQIFQHAKKAESGKWADMVADGGMACYS